MEPRPYSSIYRLMHWAMAFCMLFLLMTIFLRMTWLNKDNVADIIQSFLASTDIAMTRDEAILLAKKIRKPMWSWHIYSGYAITGLFFIRLTLPLFGSMKFANPFNKALSYKVKFQYWVYLIFYVCLIITLLTGLIIELGPKNLKDTMESIHTLSLYYLIPFLIIHLGGVLMAEFTTHPGIISSIVRGHRDGN